MEASQEDILDEEGNKLTENGEDYVMQMEQTVKESKSNKNKMEIKKYGKSNGKDKEVVKDMKSKEAAKTGKAGRKEKEKKSTKDDNAVRKEIEASKESKVDGKEKGASKSGKKEKEVVKDMESKEAAKTGKAGRKEKEKDSTKDDNAVRKEIEASKESKVDGKEKGASKSGKKEKEVAKESKNKSEPSEIIKNLLQLPSVPESVKKSVKNFDLDRDFDVGKVARSIMKALEPILKSELERYSKSKDPFDRLVSNDEGIEQPVDQLEFCLDILKAFAFEIPDVCELLQMKFKNTLIRCVLCSNVPYALCNEASLICEHIMEKSKYIEEDNDIEGGEKWLSVFFWVVKRALCDGATRSEVKRVWAMHKLLNIYIVTDTSPVIDTLKAMVVSPNFLQHKEGRQHVAHLLSFKKILVVPFYLKIKETLPSLIEKSKSLACSYGEVFNMAWTNALPEVREILEEEVFQRLMEIYLKLDRPKKFTQGVIGKTIFRILSYLHNCRRLLQLSSAITRLYQPILWRSLKSHHPLERCNAAELFLDVFPLEKPEANKVENSNLMKKQFRQIMDLLQDESHLTRIVAIRGVTLIFKRRIECLSNAHCREILSWVANELANDGSSYLVRVAVWEFFSSLAALDDPPEFLMSLLPQMTNHFHDSSDKVRKAFTLMLLNVGENPHLGITITDIAPRHHIIARLALEGEAVGKLLSKLIMKSVYCEGLEIMEFIKRLKRLILQCPSAAENLFRWSANVLTVKNAHFVIMAILVYLRQFTKDRLQSRTDGSGKSTCHMRPSDQNSEETESGNQEDLNLRDIENVPSVANKHLTASPSASPVKKKRKKNKVSLPQNHDENINEDNTIDIDGPTAEIHAHMLGCVHTVWVVFSNQLDTNPTMIDELNQVLTVCLQNYLRCYKGTPAWYASLSLASLVPLTKLSENTTASSSCLAELRRTEPDTPIAHTKTLIYTLTAWNRGYEIIELAIDYIDPAFKLFQLNSSVCLTVREGKGRSRVVRFVKDGGKEMIGLRLLSLLFYDYHNETRLLKHHDRVYELFSYLEGIKVVLEARYGNGLNKESYKVLTDTFIKECFSIMLNLVPVLNRNEKEANTTSPAFISSDQMTLIIGWALKILLPHVRELKNVECEEDEDSEDDAEEEEENEEEEEAEGEKKKNKRKTKKKKQSKKTAKKEVIEDDLCVSCLKAILQETSFMIKTNVTDTAHIVASANFALSLIKNEGKYWFIEDCLELVVAISEHTRAWYPKDEDNFLSIICPSVYSHILLSLTTNAYLTQPLLQRYNCDFMSIRRKLLFFPNILLCMYGANCDKFAKVFSSIIGSCIAAVQAEAIKIDTIDTVSRIEDLPLGVRMVTQAILASAKLLPLIVPAIFEFAQDNNEDGIVVVCSLSYLYTLLESNNNKLNRSEMADTVQTLYQLVQTLPLPTTLQPTSPRKDSFDKDDSFFLEPLAKLDARKIGTELLQKIADNVPCQLVRPLSSVSVRKSLLSKSFRAS